MTNTQSVRTTSRSRFVNITPYMVEGKDGWLLEVQCEVFDREGDSREWLLFFRVEDLAPHWQQEVLFP